jgi:hypothetical protein
MARRSSTIARRSERGLNKIAVTLYDVFGYLLVPRVDGKKLKTLAEPFAGRSM